MQTGANCRQFTFDPTPEKDRLPKGSQSPPDARHSAAVHIIDGSGTSFANW
jgi:hypothetical protein